MENRDLWFKLQDLIRPLASKEKKTRAENIALTHLETAGLWIDSQAIADEAQKKG